MKKRSLYFLMAALIALAIAATGCGQRDEQAASKEPPKESAKKPAIELKMSHFMSPKHVQHANVMEPFAKEVEKVTEGRVKISIFPGAALAKPATHFEAAATGITDIAFGLHGYTAGKFPLTSVMLNPFLATSAKAGSDILWELYKKFPEIGAEHKGTKVLWLWTGDPGVIVTAKKQVKTLEDLKGLKLRSPAAELNSVIEAWGATPVTMPINELYEAMQKGVVDGTLVPPSGIIDFNLQNVAKYVTKCDVYVSTFFMVMNPDSWKKIDPADQAKIEKLIGKPMSEKAAKAYDDAAKAGLELAQKSGMTIYTPPHEEMAKFKEKVAGIGKTWAEGVDAKGLPGSNIHQEALKLAQMYNK